MFQFLVNPKGVQYTLRGKLDEGGFGEVFLAIRDDGLEVAIKIIPPREVGEKAWQAGMREATTAVKCLNHPHIVQIYDYFPMSQGHFVIVMERARMSVHDMLATGHRFPPKEICVMGTHVLSALEHIHSQNVIHRDVTPKNILLFSDGTLKLADFGISKRMVWFWELAQTLIGLPAYLPPELVMFEKPQSTFRSDQYQLGLVLLHLMINEPPITAGLSRQEYQAHIVAGTPRKRAESLISRGGTLGDLAKVISVMLRRRSEYRFASAAKAQAELNRIAST